MNLWPLVLDLTVEPVEGRRVHLWIPLFLLWPLLGALAVIALMLALLADVVLVLIGRAYQGYTVLLWRVLALFADTKGMHLRFNDKTAAVEMTFL